MSGGVLMEDLDPRLPEVWYFNICGDPREIYSWYKHLRNLYEVTGFLFLAKSGIWWSLDE